MENTAGESDESMALQQDRLLTKREKRELVKKEKLNERVKSENSGKIKKTLLWLIAIVVVAFGGYQLWQWINTPQPDPGASSILSVKSDDWVRGNPNARVTVIEYADFECPACKIYSTEVLPKIESEYKDNLRIVFRHFPLPQHKNALAASKAAEAAGMQGKFWEMADLLYEKQSEWDSVSNVQDKMVEYANFLVLNTDQFLSDYNSDIVSQSIKDNEDEAYMLRVDATPTFFVNGKKVNVPSHRVSINDVIAIREGSKKSVLFTDMGKRLKDYTCPNWLSFNVDSLAGKIEGKAKNIEGYIDLNTVLEFYSR